MFFSHALVALVGFGSLAASAPAPMNGVISRRPVRPRESKNNSNKNNNKDNSKNNNNNRNNNNGNGQTQIISIQDNTVIIQQTIIQPQVIIVEENLGLVDQLALVAEQEFQALVQSELALIQEIETIKNNIRVNTFLARFSQVNTVIVSVTQVIDLRNGDANRNTRYMVNQQLADNGKSQSTVVVMLSAASPVTINAATPTLNLGGLLSNSSSGAAGIVSAAAASTATAAAAAAAASVAAGGNGTGSSNSKSNSANIAGFDAANPFGQLGQTVILPYGSKAPSLPNGAQLVADPASIILANQNTLIVEDITQFSQDCQVFNSNGLSLFNLQSSIIQEAAQIAALEVSGLNLGSAATLNSVAAALLGGAGVGAVAGTVAAAPVVETTVAAAPAAVETTVAAAPAAVETAAAAPPVETTAAAETAAAAPAVETAAPAVETAAPAVETAAAAPAAEPTAAEPTAAAPVGFFTPAPAAPTGSTEAAAAVAVGAAAAPSVAPAPPAAPAASAAPADVGSGVQIVPIA